MTVAMAAEDKTIHTVEATNVLMPTYGAVASSEAEADILDICDLVVSYYSYSENRWLAPVDIFEDGEEYAVCLKVFPDTSHGYSLASDVTVTINGMPTEYWSTYNAYIIRTTVTAPTYTVTFDLGNFEVEAPEPQQVKQGKLVQIPEIDKPEGMDIFEWHTTPELDHEFHVDTEPISGDITLYAKWYVHIQIYCSPISAALVGLSSTDLTANSYDKFIPYSNTETVVMRVSVNDGYIFEGWHLDSPKGTKLVDYDDKEYDVYLEEGKEENIPNLVIKLTQPFKVYALCYEDIPVTVTVDYNYDGVVKTEDYVGYKGQTLAEILPQNYSYEYLDDSMEFDCLVDAKENGNPIDETQIVEEDVTIYVQWKEVPPTPITQILVVISENPTIEQVPGAVQLIEDAPMTCENMYWYNVTDDKVMEASEIFEGEKTYRLYLKDFELIQGYCYPDVAVLEGVLMGATLDYSFQIESLEEGETSCYFEMTIPVPDVIEIKAITVEGITNKIVNGAIDTSNVTIVTRGASIASIEWQTTTGDPVTEFVPGDIYRLHISYEVDEKHIMSDTIDLVINDNIDLMYTNITSDTIDIDVYTIVDNYQITVDLNGGTEGEVYLGSQEVPGETKATIYEPDESFVIPPQCKVFDAVEIEGERIEVGTEYTVHNDITLKILWKDSHTLIKVERVEATTKAAGNIEHYRCEVCKKLFDDENATNELTKKQVTIPRKTSGGGGSSSGGSSSSTNTSNQQEQEEHIWSNASDWAKEELIKAEKEGLIPNTLAKKDFTEKITRKDFVAVAVKLYEVISKKQATPSLVNPFIDTDDEEVLKAYQLGITKGTSEDTFSPDHEITREQMATMLTRTLFIAGIEIQNGLPVMTPFADDDVLHDWGRNAVYFMAGFDIIKGIGENQFGGLNPSTIEQSLAIVLRSVTVYQDSSL